MLQQLSMDCILQAPAPPPQSDADTQTEKSLEMFKKISGADLEVDAYELRDILNSAFMKGDSSIIVSYLAACAGN